MDNEIGAADAERLERGVPGATRNDRSESLPNGVHPNDNLPDLRHLIDLSLPKLPNLPNMSHT